MRRLTLTFEYDENTTPRLAAIDTGGPVLLEGLKSAAVGASWTLVAATDVAIEPK